MPKSTDNAGGHSLRYDNLWKGVTALECERQIILALEHGSIALRHGFHSGTLDYWR